MTWATSTRKERLPSDWQTLRPAILERDGYRCTVIRRDGRRCSDRATDAHHLDPGAPPPGRGTPRLRRLRGHPNVQTDELEHGRHVGPWIS
jgi:hypothetical protein